jgi:hypothetical protein
MTEPDRITALAHDTTHVAEGLAMLARQFRGKPRFEAMLTSWLRQVQDLEDAWWQILVETTLDAAVGAQLDQLGEILGLARSGLSDTLYRRALRAQILALRSRGTADELIRIAELVAGWACTYTAPGDAAVIVTPSSVPDIPTASLAALLRRAAAGGVRIDTVDILAGDLFAFASGETVETDAARGFSTTAGLVGGKLVGVVGG